MQEECESRRISTYFQLEKRTSQSSNTSKFKDCSRKKEKNMGGMGKRNILLSKRMYACLRGVVVRC